MFGICVESSHQRGMGNLFRSLNLVEWMRKNGYDYIMMINDDIDSTELLKARKIKYTVVDLWNYEFNWEKQLIQKYKIDVWIDDRLAIDIRHAKFVKDEGIKLCSFDDTGSGAELTDINFCSMVLENTDRLKGNKVITDIKYMILNPAISKYRRVRAEKKKVLILMGGSDTYGVTIDVAKAIHHDRCEYTIVTGFCFADMDELQKVVEGKNIRVVSKVANMMEFMSEFDLAITAGGITPFEAIAQGIPCVIISTETHEEQVGRFFKRRGCAEYLGFYKEADYNQIEDIIDRMDVRVMSETCLKTLRADGVNNVMNEILNT